MERTGTAFGPLEVRPVVAIAVLEHLKIGGLAVRDSCHPDDHRLRRVLDGVGLDLKPGWRAGIAALAGRRKSGEQEKESQWHDPIHG